MRKLADISLFESLGSGCSSCSSVFNFWGNDKKVTTDLAPEPEAEKAVGPSGSDSDSLDIDSLADVFHSPDPPQDALRDSVSSNRELTDDDISEWEDTIALFRGNNDYERGGSLLYGIDPSPNGRNFPSYLLYLASKDPGSFFSSGYVSDLNPRKASLVYALKNLEYALQAGYDLGTYLKTFRHVNENNGDLLQEIISAAPQSDDFMANIRRRADELEDELIADALETNLNDYRDSKTPYEERYPDEEWRQPCPGAWLLPYSDGSLVLSSQDGVPVTPDDVRRRFRLAGATGEGPDFWDFEPEVEWNYG